MDNGKELNKKRKNDNDFQIPRGRFSDHEEVNEDDNDFLTLSLSIRPSKHRRSSPLPQQEPPPPPPPQQPQFPPRPQFPPQLSVSQPLYMPQTLVPLCYPRASSSMPLPVAYHREAGPSRPQPRVRRNSAQAARSDTVPAPFPWATNQRATVHSFKELQSRAISSIKGEVQCKRCEKRYEMEFDLAEEFSKVWNFIVQNKSTMHDRAPAVWMNPVLPTCKLCRQENSAKPVISEKKKSINWLFLLLGQMLGCCTLEQLKYFCKHTKNHRTGAKDRVLYLAYLGLCKQLDPNGPFDR